MTKFLQNTQLIVCHLFCLLSPLSLSSSRIGKRTRGSVDFSGYESTPAAVDPSSLKSGNLAYAGQYSNYDPNECYDVGLIFISIIILLIDELAEIMDIMDIMDIMEIVDKE